MPAPKLYMLLLGCRPKGRHTEQHDIFFTIGTSLTDIVPAIHAFWPEVKGNIHIDAWREVTVVDGYEIRVVPREERQESGPIGPSLFFINLGGYREHEFEEFHYKVLTVAENLEEAKAAAKKTTFYRHTGFGQAVSHIDDRYGVDTDDAHLVKDILPPSVKAACFIKISPAVMAHTDAWHLGFLPLKNLT